MLIICLDGYALNPGDISWERFEAIARKGGALGIPPQPDPLPGGEGITASPPHPGGAVRRGAGESGAGEQENR